MIHRLSVPDYLSTLPLSIKTIITLPADASHRTFHRLITEDASLILMDAPPPLEDIRPYVQVADVLKSHNLSAPLILHQDAVQGYVVMEDLGEDTFTRVLASSPKTEPALYQSALSVLVHLTHQAPPPADLPPYDLALLMRELALYPPSNAPCGMMSGQMFWKQRFYPPPKKHWFCGITMWIT